MKATVKNWILKSSSCPDIGSYQVTVTLYGPSVTLAVTFPGPLTRKRALGRLYGHLLRENNSRGCWSPHLLRDVRDLADGRKANR